MFCHRCGKKAPEGASFCGHCGTQLVVPATDGAPSAPQPHEAADPQYTECLPLDIFSALRRIFAKYGVGSKCIQPLSPDVCQGVAAKAYASLPDEKLLALFGTEKKGEFRGILVTDAAVRWRICEAGSDTKWCEGWIEHSKVDSIGFVKIDDGDSLFIINDKAVGVFATGRSVMGGERKTDGDALSAVTEYCRLVSARPPAVEYCTHPVEWMFNGNLGEKPPISWVSLAIVGLCVLMYLIQWMMGAFDSDEELVKVAKSLGGDVPVFGYLVCGFMHGGIIHLVANLLGLATFCISVEKVLGKRLFAAAYFASVLGGGLCAAAMHPDVMAVGASGGLFGIMGAICVFGGIRFWVMKKGLSSIDRHKVYRWMKGYGALLLGNLYFTFRFAKIANVSIGGHLGGLLAGAVLGIVALMFIPPRRELCESL